MKHFLIFFIVYSCIISCVKKKEISFDKINKYKEWNLVFNDDCTNDWTQKWTLDGLIATVENSNQGMHFKAGPEYKNDAHHAVLWTKKTFAGDIKIEYDFTKIDDEARCVNILYIQATGDEEGIYEKDISKWEKLREVPAMRTYFENMNTFHISYSAFGNQENSFHYVRARRYPKPDDKPFKVTQIEPSYDKQGYFKSGQTYHITAIKTADHLFFKMESKDGTELFKWNISKIKPIVEGRIGLRHMFTRSSMYKNFKIYAK